MTSTAYTESSAAVARRFLHLKGVNINFTARRPDSAIFVRVQVEEQTYESQAFGEGIPVTWDRDIYVSSASIISISCHRKQTVTKKFFKRKPYAEVTIDLKSVRIEDGSMQSSPDECQRVVVELIFGQSIERKKALKLLGEGASSALAGKVVLLEKIGKISDFVGDVIEVGAAFAELNDVAKVVFGVADVVFKNLQRQRECHEAAVSLAGFVLDKLPITDIIPEKMQNDLIRNSLEKMLEITEEAFIILNKYADDRTFDMQLGTITNVKIKLSEASSNFSLALTAQNNVMAQESKERQEVDMLEKLRPVPTARYSEGHGCLEDTRIDLLGEFTDWSEERSPSFKLVWLHGFAGSGKSSIAATVCDELEAKDMLAGSFFCKRDVPEQRESGRILPSLSNTLALMCKPYRECIIRALEKEPSIASRQISYQLTTLFRNPFSELRQKKYTFERPVVFVVDALDECGTDDLTRSQMAQPLPELEEKFALLQTLRSIDLNARDSGGGIMKYTRSCLQEFVEAKKLDRKWLEDDVIRTLSRKASGLFIWMSTVTKFVRGQYDQDAAMEKIIAGQDVDPRSSLDTLYLAVIRNSRGASDATNLSLMKTVLGIIC